MKKTILVVTALSCINLSMFAQTSSNRSFENTEKIELLASVNNVKGEEVPVKTEEKNHLQSKVEIRQMKQEQRKQKRGLKDMSLGAKIGIGALFVVIVVLFIVTGGEGYKSR